MKHLESFASTGFDMARTLTIMLSFCWLVGQPVTAEYLWAQTVFIAVIACVLMAIRALLGAVCVK